MALTIARAKEIVDKYYAKSCPTKEDDFSFAESLEYLIHETGESNYMMQLGGWYYARKQFDLAEKYYLLAAELKDVGAYECLGYIYYYGRVGKPDYQKAFENFKLASEAGDIIASYKMADMYRNGYYVEKDEEKYASIIKSLYPKIRTAKNVFDPLPEIYSRLAKIYQKEGKTEEAIQLLLTAKDFQGQRLKYNGFFGDLTIMKYIVLDLYDLIEFDSENMDLFDLYYVLKYPAKVLISIYPKKYTVEAIEENNHIYIRFNDQNYENVDELFLRAKVKNERLSAQYTNVDYMELVSWK